MIGKSGPVLATAVTVGSGRFCALLLPRLHLLSLPTFRSCCFRFDDRMSIVARCVYPRFFFYGGAQTGEIDCWSSCLVQHKIFGCIDIILLILLYV